MSGIQLKLKLPRLSGGGGNQSANESPQTPGTPAMNTRCDDWIGRTFNKRECSRYLPVNDERRCGCGRPKSAHSSMRNACASPIESSSASVSAFTYRGERWLSSRHTTLLPTDAYGKVEFYGVAHSNRANYVRLDHESTPDDVLHLMLNVWKLEPPRLLISVHGGRSRFALQPKIRFAFSKGLVKAARTTSAWIITDGSSKGVAEHVGKAIDSAHAAASVDGGGKRVLALGIVPWGYIHRKESLLGCNTHVTYNSSANVRDAMVLNGSHSCFLIADDGTHGRSGADSALRARLEQFISTRKLSKGSYQASSAVPMVCVVLEGDGATLRTVAEYVTGSSPTRVVVVDGSGPAADIIAFAHRHSPDDGQIPEKLREGLLGIIQKTFSTSEEKARVILSDLDLCMSQKGMITVFRTGDQREEFDVAILTSLLRSHGLTPSQQLALTLMWNRCDIASYQLFNYEQEWPEEALEQSLAEALAQDKVAFVRLLIEKGINMTSFLTVARLEQLYNTVAPSSPTITMMLRYVRAKEPLTSRISLMDIGLIMDRLMGGDYRSNYRHREFKQAYRGIMQNIAATVNAQVLSFNGELPNPYNDLMIWAVLSKRQEMAKFMWRHEQEAMAKALMAARMYSAMSRLSHNDPLAGGHSSELHRFSKEFQLLALDVLDCTYKQNEVFARQLLVYELKNWGRQTCLNLASGGEAHNFIAHACCQRLISDIWMGGLSSNSMINVKVLCGLALPAVIPLLNYKTPAALSELPLTAEEHKEQRTRRARSDSTRRDEQETPGSTAGSSAALFTNGGDRIVLDLSLGASGKSEEDYVTWSMASPPTISQKDGSGGGSPAESSDDDRRRAAAYNYRRSGNASRTSQILGITVLHPELPMASRFVEFYRAPITKFWFHLVAYLVFLGMLTYSVLVDMVWEPHPTEVYTTLYVTFESIELVRKVRWSKPRTLYRKMTATFGNGWTLMKAIAVIAFWIGTTMRFLPPHEVQLSGHVLYSIDSILWYMLVMEYFQVSSHLGPFIVIVANLWEHLMKFVIFFFVFVVAYGVPRQAIFFPEESPSWDLVVEVLTEPYFMIYGELYADKINPPCGEGDEFEYKCWPGRWLVPLLTSVYLLVTYVLLMNLLIAVFNTAYRKFNSISRQIWMYQRYDLTLEYDQKPVFPPPFVIISYCSMLYRHLRRPCGEKNTTLDKGIKLFLSKEETQKLLDFEQECVSGYLDEKDYTVAAKSHGDNLSSDRIESLMVKIDDIYQRENQLHAGLMYLVQKWQELSEESSDFLRRKESHAMATVGHSETLEMTGDKAESWLQTCSPTRNVQKSPGPTAAFVSTGDDSASPASAIPATVTIYSSAAAATAPSIVTAELANPVTQSTIEPKSAPEDSSAWTADASGVAGYLNPSTAASSNRPVSPAVSITVSLDDSEVCHTLDARDATDPPHGGGRSDSRRGGSAGLAGGVVSYVEDDDGDANGGAASTSSGQRHLAVGSALSVPGDAFGASYVERSFALMPTPLMFGAGVRPAETLGGVGGSLFVNRFSQAEYTSTTDCIEPFTSYSTAVTPRQSLSPDGGFLDSHAGAGNSAIDMSAAFTAAVTVPIVADVSHEPRDSPSASAAKSGIVVTMV